MSGFLTDTLLWTGALLALVLLLRRPVAALFGPTAAYALWGLPMVRLLLPPLVLPAWMAPAPPAIATPAEPAGAAELAAWMAPAPSEIAAPPELAGSAVGTTFAAPGANSTLTDFADVPLVDWGALLLWVWLAGAAVFLVRRYALYFRMRRELLADARPMGEAGRVRLVETPAADGPVAFGVIDKVVALPVGFMADSDRAGRDLALAHELAHHRGGDLLCNMLVQPLFALHWFSPLGVLGWRALRRDQEAACDARVIASEPRERRAAYAAVIARFAVQPRDRTRLALAAPMACPVLGDRSIVQRLRGLTMTDISPRRRLAGRLLLGAAGLVLPLTASISYAQSEVAPASPPAPPSPPAPAVAAVAPASPEVPALPDEPRDVARRDGETRILRIERVAKDGDRTDAPRHRIERRIVVRGEGMSARERAELDREMAEVRAELERELGPNGELHLELKRSLGETGQMNREIRIAVAEATRVGMEAARIGAETARLAVMNAPRVTTRCRPGQREVSETVVGRDGRQEIFVCDSLATASAARAIAVARAEVSRSRELTDRQRAAVLRSLEEAERETRAN